MQHVSEVIPSVQSNRGRNTKSRRKKPLTEEEALKRAKEADQKTNTKTKTGRWHLPSKDLTGFDLREIAVGAAKFGVLIRTDGTYKCLDKIPTKEEIEKMLGGPFSLVNIPPVQFPEHNITTMLVRKGSILNDPQNAIAAYITLMPLVHDAIWIRTEYVNG